MTDTPTAPDAAPAPAGSPPRLAVTLNAHLSAAVEAAAAARGVTPEAMVHIILRETFPIPPLVPRDDWERRLLAIGIDCGVSPPDSAFSSEELYD